jgi:hypothetical protein
MKASVSIERSRPASSLHLLSVGRVLVELTVGTSGVDEIVTFIVPTRDPNGVEGAARE